MLFKKGFEYKILSTHSDGIGRLLLVNIEVNAVNCTLCNVYCPNNVTERVNFLSQITSFVHKYALSKQNLYIGGDFNCVESAVDRVSEVLDRSSAKLTEIKKELNLVDVWRSCNPNLKDFTYIDPTRKGRDSRIDIWLIPKPIMHNIKSCNIIQAPAPDHKAVHFDVLISNRRRGKGYWKMNNSILIDEQYKTGIIALYNDTLDQYSDNVSCILLWEYLKVKIKEFTISYCIRKSQSTKSEIKDLEEKLDLIDKSNNTELCADKTSCERRKLKEKLDSLYENRATGYFIRSRARWVEEGERSTSYFLTLEKSRQASNCINCLKDARGTNSTQTMAFSIVLSHFTSSYTQVMQHLLRILMHILNLFLVKINSIMNQN